MKVTSNTALLDGAGDFGELCSTVLRTHGNHLAYIVHVFPN